MQAEKPSTKASAPTGAVGPLQKILDAKNAKVVKKEEPKKIVPAKAAPVHKDPYLEQEEMELARLAKLLGIEKGGNKKKAASKLNKEFDLYEGMGEGFGDFLMELDDLTDMVEGKVDRKSVFHGRDEDEKPSRKPSKHHMIDEDEQEASDIDDEFDGDFSDEFSQDGSEDGEGSEGEEMGSDEGSEGFEDMSQEDGSEGNQSGSEGADGDNDDDEEEDVNDQGAESDPSGEEDSRGDDEGDEDDKDMSGDEEGSQDYDSNDSGSEGSGDEEGSEDSEAEAKRKEKEHAMFTYKPVSGEDIYGRSTEKDAATGDKPAKYVPPAKRKASLMEVDEVSQPFSIFQFLRFLIC